MDVTPCDMETPAERLKWARLRRFPGSEASEIARLCEWNVHTYGNHERGDRNLTKKTAEKYAAKLGVTAEWLLFGTGKKVTSEHGQKLPVAEKPSPRIDSRRLPRLIWGMINNEKSVNAAILKAGEYVDIPSGMEFGKSAFSLIVPDDTMFDRANPFFGFAKGQNVVFDPDIKAEPGDFVLARVDGEPLELFRQYRRAGKTPEGAEQIELLPLNPHIESVRFTPGVNGQIIAKLVCHVRTFS